MSDDGAAPTGGEIGTIAGGAATGVTTALSVGALAGSAVGPVGIIVGAVVGAAIGVGIVIAQRNTKKDPKEDYTAPEVDRRRSPNADQGNPAPWVHGKWIRVPGQLIYMSRINSGRDEEGEQYDECTLLVAWCRNITTAVKRVYANGEVIFDDSTITDNIFDCDEVDYDPKWGQSGSKSNPITKAKHIIYYYFSPDQWDPTDIWNSQVNFNVTGLAGSIPANTGNMKLIEHGLKGSRYYLKFIKCESTTANGNTTNTCGATGIPADQASGGSYTYSFGGTGAANKTHFFDDPTHYLGTDAQTPHIFGHPAYRGTTYSALPLNLAKWGGAVPRLEALVQVEESPPTLETVLDRIIRRGGAQLGASVAIDGLSPSTTVRGLVILGATTPNAMIQELMAFYKVDAFETFKFGATDINGNPVSEYLVPTLQFVDRDAGDTFTIPAADYGAREEGQEGIDRQQIDVPDDRDEPNHLVLDYIASEERDFQPASFEFINEAWEGQIDRKRVAKMRTDLVLSDAEAEQACKTLLFTMQNYRSPISITLPPHWAKLRPNDRIIWNPNNNTESIEFRILRVTRGQNGLLALDGVIDDTLAFEQLPDNDIPPARTPNNGGPFSESWPFDLPPLTYAHAFQFGVYHSAVLVLYEASDPINYADTGQTQPSSAVIYKSPGGLAEWSKQYTQHGYQPSGVTRSQIGAATCFAWDTATVITVEVDNPSVILESATPDEVGSMKKNVMVVGGEIIGFADVVDLGDGLYELSYLLRGMRNTEDSMDTHIADAELFFLLTGPNFKFLPLPFEDYGQLLDFRAVPITEDLDSDSIINHGNVIPSAETLRPFSVRSRWLRRYPDKKYRIYFKARTRIPHRLFSGIPTPQAEPHWCFKIDVFWTKQPDAENGREYVRTLCCQFDHDDEFFMDYTRAMQIEDFHDTGRIIDGSFPLKLEFEIYRMSATIGEGRRNVLCTQFEGPFVQFDVDCISV